MFTKYWASYLCLGQPCLYFTGDDSLNLLYHWSAEKLTMLLMFFLDQSGNSQLLMGWEDNSMNVCYSEQLSNEINIFIIGQEYIVYQECYETGFCGVPHQCTSISFNSRVQLFSKFPRLYALYQLWPVIVVISINIQLATFPLWSEWKFRAVMIRIFITYVWISYDGNISRQLPHIFWTFGAEIEIKVSR